jgi:hypothetical protein
MALSIPNSLYHTCKKKQGDFTSPSENMREKWRHDREISNNFIETCFLQRCVVSSCHFFLIFNLKCAFANILLISFILNFKFMFCSCIIVVYLMFVDFRFDSFHIEIYKICITSKCEFLPLVSIKMPPCLKLDKLIVFFWNSYK